MNSEIKLFGSGIYNSVIGTEIPQDASRNSLNWITQDGRIKLIGGRRIIGVAGGLGGTKTLWSGYRSDGTKVIYRKISDRLQYLKSGVWTDIITGLTDTEFSCANYSSLAGSFTLFNGIDGFYLINNANPESSIDIYDSTKNFKGYILIDRGRTLLWNRDSDKTGLYGSYVDVQNSTVYTSITGESVGALGSTNYTGTVAHGGGINMTFAYKFTDGTQTLTDDFNGNLIGDGTGTINYATGEYNITFNATTTGAVTVDYQYQDFTNKGIADFSHSSPRLAGEGFQFPQDEGGDPILNVLIGQDGAYYSLKKHSVYRLSLSADDLNADNIVFRKELGLENWKGAVSTSMGIVFINTTNQDRPELTILKKNQFDTIEPYPLSPQFDFSLYDYSKAVMITYERYILLACKEKGKDENNVILAINVKSNTVDIIEYEASDFTTDNDTLYCGSTSTDNVYQILTGYDDQNSKITNYWSTKEETYNSLALKKFRKLRFRGKIAKEQSVSIYGSFDGSDYSLLGEINGSASYVETDNAQLIGTNFIGTAKIGGDNSSEAYNFYCEIRIKVPKFRKRQIKLVAEGFGYLEIEQMVDFDVLRFEDRLPKKFRVKR